MRIISILAMGVLFAGCATGFNRQAIQERLADQPIEVTDAQVQAALARKAQLRFPIKLAIHLAAETYQPGHGRLGRFQAASWRWTLADKERIDQWAKPLREAGVISDMYVMSGMISGSDDVKDIRLAAAKHGADAFLLVKGVTQVDSYANWASISNLLIIPGYVVPGSHRDALLLMRGAMWDVRNECLYLSVDAEGEAKTKGPTFRIKEDDAVDAAKQAALESFGKELQKRLMALKGTPAGE